MEGPSLLQRQWIQWWYANALKPKQDSDSEDEEAGEQLRRAEQVIHPTALPLYASYMGQRQPHVPGRAAGGEDRRKRDGDAMPPPSWRRRLLVAKDNKTLTGFPIEPAVPDEGKDTCDHKIAFHIDANIVLGGVPDMAVTTRYYKLGLHGHNQNSSGKRKGNQGREGQGDGLSNCGVGGSGGGDGNGGGDRRKMPEKKGFNTFLEMQRRGLRPGVGRVVEIHEEKLNDRLAALRADAEALALLHYDVASMQLGRVSGSYRSGTIISTQGRKPASPSSRSVCASPQPRRPTLLDAGGKERRLLAQAQARELLAQQVRQRRKVMAAEAQKHLLADLARREIKRAQLDTLLHTKQWLKLIKLATIIRSWGITFQDRMHMVAVERRWKELMAHRLATETIRRYWRRHQKQMEELVASGAHVQKILMDRAISIRLQSSERIRRRATDFLVGFFRSAAALKPMTIVKKFRDNVIQCQRLWRSYKQVSAFRMKCGLRQIWDKADKYISGLRIEQTVKYLKEMRTFDLDLVDNSLEELRLLKNEMSHLQQSATFRDRSEEVVQQEEKETEKQKGEEKRNEDDNDDDEEDKDDSNDDDNDDDDHYGDNDCVVEGEEAREMKTIEEVGEEQDNERESAECERMDRARTRRGTRQRPNSGGDSSIGGGSGGSGGGGGGGGGKAVNDGGGESHKRNSMPKRYKVSKKEIIIWRRTKLRQNKQWGRKKGRKKQLRSRRHEVGKLRLHQQFQEKQQSAQGIASHNPNTNRPNGNAQLNHDIHHHEYHDEPAPVFTSEEEEAIRHEARLLARKGMKHYKVPRNVREGLFKELLTNVRIKYRQRHWNDYRKAVVEGQVLRKRKRWMQSDVAFTYESSSNNVGKEVDATTTTNSSIGSGNGMTGNYSGHGLNGLNGKRSTAIKPRTSTSGAVGGLVAGVMERMNKELLQEMVKQQKKTEQILMGPGLLLLTSVPMDVMVRIVILGEQTVACQSQDLRDNGMIRLPDLRDIYVLHSDPRVSIEKLEEEFVRHVNDVYHIQDWKEEMRTKKMRYTDLLMHLLRQTLKAVEIPRPMPIPLTPKLIAPPDTTLIILPTLQNMSP